MYICIYVYVYMYICIYIYMYICLYIYMYIFFYSDCTSVRAIGTLFMKILHFKELGDTKVHFVQSVSKCIS